MKRSWNELHKKKKQRIDIKEMIPAIGHTLKHHTLTLSRVGVVCNSCEHATLYVFWIYRLLVFGQRHNSHLSCFISELIYFHITILYLFFISFVHIHRINMNNVSIPVFLIVAHFICCGSARNSLKNLSSVHAEPSRN